MTLFSGLLRVIEEKGLRKKYSSAIEGRLLAFWLDGWPATPPLKELPMLFKAADSETYIFTDEFTPWTYKTLLGRIANWIDLLSKKKLRNFQLHITTSIDDWVPDNAKRPVREAERIQGMVLEQLTTLKIFLGELCGEEISSKVFLNVDGVYPEEERKSICRLLISNL